MTRTPSTRLTRCLLLLAVVAIVLQLVGVGSAFAQDTVPQQTGEVEQPNPGDSAPPADEQPVAPPAPDEEPAPGGEAPAAPAEVESELTVAERLSDEFGVALEELDLEPLQQRIVEVDTKIAELAEARTNLESRRSTATAVRQTLSEQAESMSEAGRTALLRPLAVKSVEIALSGSDLQLLQSHIAHQKSLLGLLEEYRAQVEETTGEVAVVEDRRRESDEAEQEALQVLELARAREERERDATIRELLARERRTAEERLAMTRQHSEALEKIESETEESAAAFATIKARLLTQIDEIPPEPSDSVRHQEADPVFSDIVTLRREARGELLTARAGHESAESRFAAAQEELAQARMRLAEEEERRSQLEGAVGDRRVAVAKASLNLAAARLEAATEEMEAYGRRIDNYEARLAFFDDTIESLLDRISTQRRAQFFSISDDKNWSDAIGGTRNRLRRIVEGAVARWDDLMDLDIASVSFWAWVWGLLWRLMIAMVLVRWLPPMVPNWVQRLTKAAFQRRFFRARPRLTIKTAEVVGALAYPALLYAAIRYVGSFIAMTFSEAEVVLWLVDAVFVYWIVVELVSVLVLPRWYRMERRKSDIDEFEAIDHDAAVMTDLFGMEVTRARKLVRSVRVVVVFWLLATYVPSLVRLLAGISVISWLVDWMARIGLIGIVYWVISTWRDDVAILFERLAKERLPKAVSFVNQHKDSFFGVLIIALASVYVIVFELSLVIRRYVLDTDAFRRASTFAFRKKIEMQAQKREETEAEEPDAAELPDDYLSYFETGPLAWNSPLYVSRGPWEAGVLQAYEEWQVHHRQGSVAFIGEAGIGKSTLLAQIDGAFVERGVMVVARSIVEKRHRRSDVISFVADLFDLDEVPASKRELIDAIHTCEPRVVMLDDCHHFFMRRIGGFEGLETLLDVVNLTDETHFWVLSFNIFAWSYVNRVSAREHYFGRVYTLPPWTDTEIQELVEARNAPSRFVMSFTELVVSHEDEVSDDFYEVVKTARGYFRYLHEFSDGNPRLAMVFWLRSIRPQGDVVQVSLFRRPTTVALKGISDNHWFVLTALAQHGALNAKEIARIINTEEGFCHLALNYFDEKGILDISPQTQRAELTPLYFRHVLKSLMNSNYLYR